MSDCPFSRALATALPRAIVLYAADTMLARAALAQVVRLVITAFGLSELSAATVAGINGAGLDVLDIALGRIHRGHGQLLTQLAAEASAWALVCSVDPDHIEIARTNLLARARDAGPLRTDPRAELVARLGDIERPVPDRATWVAAAVLALDVARIGLHVAVARAAVPTTRPAPPPPEGEEEECDA